MEGIIFGKKYLRERKPKAKAKVEKKILREEERPRNLEEIIATLSPFEKAILWAIGTGNYHASDIYEVANKN